MTDEVRYAGLVGPHRESHEPRLLVTRFCAPQPTSGFQDWDGTSEIVDWGMDGNNQFGDCGPAATDHNNAAKCGNVSVVGTLGVPEFNATPDYSATLETYFAYGRAQGEPGTAPDYGVDNATWLAFLYKNGIIKGYGEVPLDQLDQYAPIGHGLILGLVIDGPVAQTDFEAVPRKHWSRMERKDGHDVLLIKTGADGSGAVVTWGGIQPFTLSFREHNITDAWIIFDEDDPTVDWDALRQALDEVHGVVAAA